MCFFFLALAVVKAVKDSFEYWSNEGSDYMPAKPARVTRVPAARARVSAIGRDYKQTIRRRSA